ncbi:bluetail domain-containing putative surface protein [Salinicola sp. LHM]|uniref:beta strand repeat-containing protein n=1 Tax=Salinicola sp. LHM TaxID=3065298 RepID=UPI002ACE0024|nr:bluetail domain-containing putative surface protein [Salinicola sp. LHM]WQH34190.1 bluetail domain-containing putative surface protein [Salinicola sp. LHM]
MPLSFDSSYYLEQYPDVKAAVDAGTIESAEAHWEQYGAEEGRNPNAVFNTEEYLAANPDVAASGMNPLTHFLQYGAAEGRAPSDAYQPIADGFDTDAYLAANTDVAAAIESGAIDSAYEHWVLYGQFEDTREATYNGGTPVTEITDPASGETSDLTKGAEEITGTAGDDTFNGVASALSSARTLDAGDAIDGGEGNDTLNVDLQSTFAGFSGDGGLTNVETVNLSNEGTIGRTFNATGVEGVEQYNLTGGVTLAGLESTDAAIALADKASGAVSIGYTDEAVEGDDDALSLSLENVGTVDDSETTDTDEREAVAVTVKDASDNTDAVESLALDVTGDNVVGLANVDATAITATGSGNLDVDATGTALETFDASAVEGNVEAALTAATSLESVTTGAGDDTVSVGSASLASVSTGAGDDTITADALRVNASIDGGEGDDRLNLSSTGTVQYAMAGIETLSLTGGDLTFSAKNVSGIETIESSATQTGAATFAGLGATDLSFDLAGVVGTAKTPTITADQTGASTVNVVADADAEEDETSNSSANLNLSKTNAVQLNVAEATTYSGTINAGNATSIEAQIDGALTGAAELNLGKATSAVFNTGEEDSTVQLVAGSLTDLNVTAGAGFELTSDSDVSSVEALTVDTAGEFDASTVATNGFDAVNQVNLSGTGQVTLADLGDEELEYGVTVNASGLTDVTVDSTTTDALTIGAINVGDGQSIEVNAADVLGSVNLTSATVASEGSINVNVDGITGAADLGDLTASDVTVDAAGALGDLGVTGAGNAVIIDADTATVTGSGLGQNFVSVDATESATVTGGIQGDEITVDNTTGGENAEFTLTGDLGGDTFTVGSAVAGSIKATITDFTVDGTDNDTLSVSGNFGIIAADSGSSATGLAAALAGDDFDAVETAAFAGTSVSHNVFEFDGSTYVAVTDATAGFGDGDVLVQLTGVTGVDDVNTLGLTAA